MSFFLGGEGWGGGVNINIKLQDYNIYIYNIHIPIIYLSYIASFPNRNQESPNHGQVYGG